MARFFFIMLWLGFIAYAFILAPPDQPETFDLIRRMSMGDWEGINPSIIAIFNAMGIWPMVYACVALIDGQGQRVLAWPFAVASFAVGAFCPTALPGLASPQPRIHWI